MSTTRLAEIKPKSKLPTISPGDTVRVNLRVIEGDKERIQPYQGVVIRIRNGGAGGTFTVRRVAYGIGIERTFPMASPLIEKLQVIRHGKVRRAKLYYLRGLSAKKARIKERRYPRGMAEELVPTAEPEQPPEPVPTPEQK
jgi:large subunit ribosomal protein L19